jgi:hypothetical protein
LTKQKQQKAEANLQKRMYRSKKNIKGRCCRLLHGHIIVDVIIYYHYHKYYDVREYIIIIKCYKTVITIIIRVINIK